MRATTLKLLTSSVAFAAALGLSGAQAATVTYGGQAASDGSGLTSSFVPATNIVNPASGYFIETFDPATQMLGQGLLPGFPTGITASPNGNVIIRPGDGCSINTYNIVSITTTGGGLGVQKGGTTNVAANPAGDNTCFGYGPRPGGGTPASVKIDYSGILTPGVRISYLGLYYGSIDDYNNVAFFNGNQLVTGSGVLSDGVISGLEVRQANGGVNNPGSWTAPGANVYINLAFDPSETFTAFEFRTTGVAFELDNIVVGLSNRNDVPEPGTLLLVGAGLVAGALAARRRRAPLSPARSA